MGRVRDPRRPVRVTWRQVRHFRLVRQQLGERRPRGDLAQVVGAVGGLQAQLVSAAQIGVWNRVTGVTPEDVEQALFRRRTLAKAWCMRRTLHLLPSGELPLFVRGSARRAQRELVWVRNKGVSEESLDRLLETTLATLAEPRTRTEIAERVSRELGGRPRTSRGAGWGNRAPVPAVADAGLTYPVVYLLHLVGARGVICHGPNREGEPTFVRADAWVPEWKDLPVPVAETALLRRYLRSFGPATPRDYVAWTGIRGRDAKEIWAAVSEELREVDVEGTNAWVLEDDVRALLLHGEAPVPVRLLPYFDGYLLGHASRQHLMADRDLRRVYRDQGWVAPTIVVDGRVAGVWSHEVQGRALRLRLAPFSVLSRRDRTALEREGRGLAEFLGCDGVSVSATV